MTNWDSAIIEIQLTCGACPEQYDITIDGEPAGYLRLRHGEFRADYPECMGQTVYEASPHGDGIFDDDERDYYMNRALAAIFSHRAEQARGQMSREPDEEAA